MPMNRSEILKKISEATVSGGGNNLRDGRGRIAVTKLALEDGFNGSRFTTEGIIVGSSKIPVTELLTGKALDIEPNAVGTDVSIVQMLDKHMSAFGNVKGFIMELYGFQGDVSQEDFADTLEELTRSNSAHGMVIDFVTYRKVTREKKIEIVLPKWQHVEQSDDDIGRMKKWLESLVLAQSAAVTGRAAQA